MKPSCNCLVWSSYSSGVPSGANPGVTGMTPDGKSLIERWAGHIPRSAEQDLPKQRIATYVIASGHVPRPWVDARFFLRYPMPSNCLSPMDAESQFSPNRSEMQSLSAFVETGPMAYDQFLRVAVLLSDAMCKTHNATMAYGEFDVDSVTYDGLSQIAMPLARPSNGDISADLQSLGAVLYHLLSGHTLPEQADSLSLKSLYPPEARMTIEKLLGLHPSGQFVSAAELYASLMLMRDIRESLENESPSSSRTKPIRLYLIISLVVLVIIVVGLITTILRK